MKIALIGYGKMGKAIEEIALQRGHEVMMKISSSNRDELTEANLRKADVAIEFTNPHAAKENVLLCLEAGVPVICGTTGWNEGFEEAELKAEATNTAFLHASNFSIGVNIFFEINKQLAYLMDSQPSYEVKIEETHHTAKKDAPSGTAITLAEQITGFLKRTHKWVKDEARSPDEIPIISHRIADVPGTHKVTYTSPIDDIEIIHTAHNRTGFALGAVLAAEFIANKKGIFTMRDVLGIR
jgi:4-hydroxy-tetrahydrodipicolinate reductase